MAFLAAGIPLTLIIDLMSKPDSAEILAAERADLTALVAAALGDTAPATRRR